MAWRFRNLRCLRDGQGLGKSMKGNRYGNDSIPSSSGKEWESINFLGPTRGTLCVREWDPGKCPMRTFTLQGDVSCLFI